MAEVGHGREPRAAGLSLGQPIKTSRSYILNACKVSFWVPCVIRALLGSGMAGLSDEVVSRDDRAFSRDNSGSQRAEDNGNLTVKYSLHNILTE